MAKRSNGGLLERAQTAQRESSTLDFKAAFATGEKRDWCDIIKDIVAMANSGGGVVVIGVNDNGTPSAADIGPVLALDLANVTNKIYGYTDTQTDLVTIHEVNRNGHPAAALVIAGVITPIVFTKPGEYTLTEGAGTKPRTKSAFAKGTVYFRHGAKSEPATSADLQRCIDREVKRQRRAWLGNIKKVTAASADDIVKVYASTDDQPEPTRLVGPVRLTSDPSATPGAILRPDQSHPHWTKDVIRLVNERINVQPPVNSFDIQSIKRAHQIDQRNDFYYKSAMQQAPQYSQSFVEWIVGQYTNDSRFFAVTREMYRSGTTTGSLSP